MRYVYEGEFPITCGECGEGKRYVGQGKKQKVVCGCVVPDKPKPRLNTARKGRRVEVAERKKLEKLGIVTRAQPGSGAFGTRVTETSLQGDNVYTIAGRKYRAEIKARAGTAGFAVILGWMRDTDVLTVKQDRQAPFHVLSDEAWLALVSAANRSGE